MPSEQLFGTPYQRALAARRRPRLSAADVEVADATVRRRRLVGSRIRQARQRLGISRQRLALQVDIKPNTLSSWENGGGSPNALHLEHLAEALGEPVHYFYGGPSAHPLPILQDPDPFTQPPPDPAAAVATVGELLAVLDRVSVLLDRLGRAGVMVGTRLDELRALGFGSGTGQSRQ